MSLAGSFLLLAYFIWDETIPSGIISNLFPCLVAAYNLRLDTRGHRRRAAGLTVMAATQASIPGQEAPRLRAAATRLTRSMGRKMTWSAAGAGKLHMGSSGHPVPCTRMA